MNRTERVAAFFAERPNRWIDGLRLMRFGSYGWRTRVSQARVRHQMTIENRIRRRANGSVVSEYRHVPRRRRS